MTEIEGVLMTANMSPTLLNFGIFNNATYMHYATLIVLSHAVECL